MNLLLQHLNDIRENTTNEESNPRHKGGQGGSDAKNKGGGEGE